MPAIDAIRQLAEPIVTKEGLELWDVEVGAGVVRVLVDRPQGVDLDALAEVSRSLSAALDAHDSLAPGGRYQLEVSSPGVERTLRTPDQYRRYLETDISVKLTAPLDGTRRLKGVLSTVGDDGIELTDESGRVLSISYDQVDRARTVLVWGPSPKPSGSNRSKQRSPKGAPDVKDAS